MGKTQIFFPCCVLRKFSRILSYESKKIMSKDPFEAAFKGQEESPPDSPIAPDDMESQTPVVVIAGAQEHNNIGTNIHLANTNSRISTDVAAPLGTGAHSGKTKEDDDEEEDDNMDVELGKLPSSGDPTKLAKMRAILSQFTEEQMSRYESFRRSGFQKSNMRRLMMNISGTQKISEPMTIVVSGIAKMLVGEVVETARLVMKERKDRGPIRPCHVREAYRRLKLEGKIPKRSVPRLFR